MRQVIFLVPGEILRHWSPTDYFSGITNRAMSLLSSSTRNIKFYREDWAKVCSWSRTNLSDFNTAEFFSVGPNHFSHISVKRSKIQRVSSVFTHTAFSILNSVRDTLHCLGTAYYSSNLLTSSSSDLSRKLQSKLNYLICTTGLCKCQMYHFVHRVILEYW